MKKLKGAKGCLKYRHKHPKCTSNEVTILTLSGAVWHLSLGRHCRQVDTSAWGKSLKFWAGRAFSLQKRVRILLGFSFQAKYSTCHASFLQRNWLKFKHPTLLIFQPWTSLEVSLPIVLKRTSNITQTGRVLRITELPSQKSSKEHYSQHHSL